MSRQKKKFKLSQEPSLDRQSAENLEPIDWTLCAQCQKSTNERLICPANSKRSDIGAGYETLDENLNNFLKAGHQPLPIDVKRLDEGGGFARTLAQNKAQWHASCRLKCSSNRFARLGKALAVPSCSNVYDAQPCMLRQKVDDTGPDSKCFFCDEQGTTSNPLHDVMTPKLTERVWHCALKLQDQKLIAKVSHIDLVAQDAKYHSKCLVKLYNSSSQKLEDDATSNNDRAAYGIALVEVVGYIAETKQRDESVASVFRLADLLQLYTERLIELGIEVSGRIHSIDLKNRLLANVPGLQAYKKGRDLMLGFSDDIGLALSEACKDDPDDEAVCLAKAANIIRET